MTPDEFVAEQKGLVLRISYRILRTVIPIVWQKYNIISENCQIDTIRQYQSGCMYSKFVCFESDLSKNSHEKRNSKWLRCLKSNEVQVDEELLFKTCLLYLWSEEDLLDQVLTVERDRISYWTMELLHIVPSIAMRQHQRKYVHICLVWPLLLVFKRSLDPIDLNENSTRRGKRRQIRKTRLDEILAGLEENNSKQPLYDFKHSHDNSYDENSKKAKLTTINYTGQYRT